MIRLNAFLQRSWCDACIVVQRCPRAGMHQACYATGERQRESGRQHGGAPQAVYDGHDTNETYVGDDLRVKATFANDSQCYNCPFESVHPHESMVCCMIAPPESFWGPG